ncbi:hypothetical protein [Microbacterium testaceum]|uniref:hypothetical protein n=1 Tax=Microbacterium testaceum TaxID=2033 RepID=UPI0022E88FB9|nr:hypothetical protein [Microbacterium testaceum]
MTAAHRLTEATDTLSTNDRYCVRGCARQHWAVCENLSADELAKKAHAEDVDETYTPPCKGCAPSVCRDRSLICDSCWGRASRLLSDAPELLTRLRAMTDGGQSRWNWDRVVTTRATHGPQATGRDDVTDAIHAIEEATRYFSAGLEQLQNDHTAMEWLGPLVLDDHPEDDDGVRERWSIRDAMRRWGLENRHRFVHPGAVPNAPAGSYARYDDEETLGPVREWFDPLLTLAQAAQRVGLSEQAVRKWVQKGDMHPSATSRGERGAVTSYFHASTVDAVAETAAARRRTAGAYSFDAVRARQLYDAGLSGRAIATELGITPGTVSKWGKAEGLTFATGTAFDKVRARELHDAGNTPDEIATTLGVSPSTVKAWRSKAGLTRAHGTATFDTARARKLYDAGHSTRAMATELGVTASTISKWGQREGLDFGKSRPQAPPAG